MQAPRPLVIIPTYNERENLESLLKAVREALPQADVLIVDDNSPDGTGAMADDFATERPWLFVLHRSRKAGLGRAYVAGFQWALARPYTHILQMDADFSHDPKDLPRLLDACQEADVAIGSRYNHGVRVLNWPLRRLCLSYGAGIYVRLFTRMPIMDPTGGFKCFRREVLEALRLDTIATTGYGFQIEVNHRAWKAGFTLKEIPIVFADRTAGTSKMSLAIAREAIFLVLRLAFKR